MFLPCALASSVFHFCYNIQKTKVLNTWKTIFLTQIIIIYTRLKTWVVLYFCIKNNNLYIKKKNHLHLGTDCVWMHKGRGKNVFIKIHPQFALQWVQKPHPAGSYNCFNCLGQRERDVCMQIWCVLPKNTWKFLVLCELQHCIGKIQTWA